MDSVLEAGPAATTFQIEYDEETSFFARRRIFEYAMQKASPFLMVVSFIHPHDPYVARPEWWNLYNSSEIDLPQTNQADDPHSKRLMHGIEADHVEVSEQQTRNARHAYYANVSYFDSKIGEISQALKEARLLDDTILIVTSDHGDMLGERGLWYKMSFFEHSVRVPLVMAGPDVQNQTVKTPCSLVDILPTLLDIGQADDAIEPAMPIDGKSLWPIAKGQSPDNSDNGEAIGEYCAECASHPLFMIRRGRLKYIHCDVDPPQLYDLIDDPLELSNLANNEAYASIATQFAEEVSKRWDSEKIRSDVIATQKQRRAVHAAMTKGQLTSWDYQPKRDSSQEFVRNHQDWTVAAEKTRFPPLVTDRDDG